MARLNLHMDYMLYQWIAVFCQEQKNIEFHIPKSFMTTIKVCNRDILLAHGDFINGGGSGTAISRGVNNMRNVMAFRKGLVDEMQQLQDNALENVPDKFETALLGHFHRVDEVDIGTGAVHICGCMKGGDEYAFFRMGVISQPLHILSYFHPKMGMICKETIFLAQFDNKPSKFKDVLPEIWAHSSAIP